MYSLLGAKVYPAGTKVTHSFTVSENSVSMTDKSENYRDSPGPGSGQRNRERDRDSDERSSSPFISRPKSPGSQRKYQPVAASPRQTNPSGATQELDDLMASLNDFKVVRLIY